MLKNLIASAVLGLVATLGAAPLATATTPQESTLSNEADKSEITFGGKVNLATTLTVNGVPIEGATVSLYRREYPASEFSFVISLETNASGRASVDHLPAKRTNYKWEFAGNEIASEATSPWQTVKVHTKVTMHLRDSSISPGQKMVAVGKTAPAKPGATATVYRTTIGGVTSKWFSGTVASDGTFRLAKRVPTTLKYRVYVVVAAHSGNLKGTSETHDLYVA